MARRFWRRYGSAVGYIALSAATAVYGLLGVIMGREYTLLTVLAIGGYSLFRLVSSLRSGRYLGSGLDDRAADRRWKRRLEKRAVRLGVPPKAVRDMLPLGCAITFGVIFVLGAVMAVTAAAMVIAIIHPVTILGWLGVSLAALLALVFCAAAGSYWLRIAAAADYLSRVGPRASLRDRMRAKARSR